MAELVKARFCIDAEGPESVFTGWHDPALRWNGWCTPEFDRDEVERIITWVHVSNAGDPDYYVTFEWDGPVLVQTNVDGGERSVERIEPNAQGRYPVGSFSWTWSELEVPDWADLAAFLRLSGELNAAYVAASNRSNAQLIAAGVEAGERVARNDRFGRAARVLALREIADDLVRGLTRESAQASDTTLRACLLLDAMLDMFKHYDAAEVCEPGTFKLTPADVIAIHGALEQQAEGARDALEEMVKAPRGWDIDQQTQYVQALERQATRITAKLTGQREGR